MYAFDTSDALSTLQDDYHPSAKRQHLDHDPYQDQDMYSEQEPVAIPYRGEHDVSADGKPVRMLLVRNLKESITESLFAKGLDKLSVDASTTNKDDPPIGASAGSLRRVLIVRDRQSEKSMQYGFAEYHHVSDATAALAKAEELGEKCTIGSKVIEVCFPHLAIFPQADTYLEGRDESEMYTIELPNTGTRHKYYVERYYVTELMVNAVAPYREPSPPQAPTPEASSEAVSATRESSPAKNVGAGDVTVQGTTLDGREKSKKRKAPGAVAPAFLQHWQNKAAELREEGQKLQVAKEKEQGEKGSKIPASGVNAISAPRIDQQQTFSIDTTKLKCCYLCAGQFQTLEGLQRHLKESPKHADNLKSDQATTRGYERLNKANVSPASTIKLLLPPPESAPAVMTTTEQTVSAYRDRAAERREAEGGSGGKGSMPKFSLKTKSNPTRTSSPSTSDTESTTKPTYGKGLGMLQKAGWAPGSGLGSGGEGIAAPIEQSLYAAGIGLGHEGSKKGDAVLEAQRLTKGDGREGFLEMTREVARQRFERMG
ncbi:hypothetical protein LTR78_005715 [Recurvomyces mirabilis]|uniref:G-patch domain-containing protein n=1 Tax=Recurvomyces mirabilis TaxID=574656 RepID=A0AAE1C0X0_9PEZI|nr:hypothetical protein LTR78_005715 [Recurvomyces mirabilis]KAK5154095.1 hypothetical protein LTS14_006780 [Recurvomyces mirabilis]